MLHFIVPIALIAAYFLWENAVDKKPKADKSKVQFFSHVQEIRDMINRCNDLAEWWTLDQEIDWLEETWKNRIDSALLLQETGQLYDKWTKRRDFITPKTA